MTLTAGKFVVPNGSPSGGRQPTKSSISGDDVLFRPIEFFNDSGAEIAACKPVNAATPDPAKADLVTGILADASSASTSAAYIGMTREAVADQTTGYSYPTGKLVCDTSALSLGGPVYLSETAGALTSTKPNHPANVVIVGTCEKVDASNGILLLDVARFTRPTANVSFSFTSQGINAGTYWKLGFYAWESTDANLAQGSPSVVLGTASRTQAAHVGIVPSGAGTVDTGVVGLQVTGTTDSSTGTQTAAQTKVISADITTLTANTMAETLEKFSGDVTIEFYTVSGSPTTYSLDFNYGFSKYEDFFNKDVTIDGFQAQWQGNANDSGFDIQLLHHKATGWTYAATGFVPGNGSICERLVDQAIESDVDNGQDGAYKRTVLATFVEGSASEGVIVKLITTQNSTIQTLDGRVLGEVETIS